MAMMTLGRTLGPVVSMLLLSFSIPISVFAQPSQDLIIYDETLRTPWINASWNAVISFDNEERAHEGMTSVKAELTSAWGALSLHYGSWGSPGTATTSYQSFTFAVFALGPGAFSVSFENDEGHSFPGINSGPITANAWTVVSVPMDQINPNNQTINRLVIQDVSGQARTFYVDNLLLAGDTPADTARPDPPFLFSPANNATSVSPNPVFTWFASPGAGTHSLQVASESDFTGPLINEAGLTDTSYSAAGLAPGAAYFWRVSGVNEAGTGDWSEIWQFTTTAPPTQPGWVSRSSGTTSTLRGVSFSDPSTGTAVGDNGTIIRTTDGGNTWAAESSGTAEQLSAVSFTDANNGAAVGGGGVFRTTDGGNTWTRLDPPSQNPVSYTDISFVDPNVGTITGRTGFDGITRRTTDGGLTWSENQQVGGSDQQWMHGVSFIDANRGIAVGHSLSYGFGGAPSLSAYLVSQTTDGGTTWNTRTLGIPYRYSGEEFPALYAVSFTSDNTAFAVGSDGLIAKTTDGGNSWTTRYTSRNATLYGVHFSDANTGMAVGANGTIVHTTNGGTTWRVQASGTTETLYEVSLVDDNTATIVGSNGIVLRTTSGGASPPIEPILASPGNEATGVAVNTTLRWDPVPEATDYHLQVSTTPDFSLLVVNEEHTTETTYALEMLSHETTYYWRVHSRSVGGSSDWRGGSFATEAVPTETAWLRQTSGTTAKLRAISFADANVGTAVGDSGVILHTLDGGATWTRQTSGTTEILSGVSFADRNKGFVVGPSGIQLETTDGGATWIQQSGPGTSLKWAVTFVDTTSGTMVGDGVHRTTDGGLTWARQNGGGFSNWAVSFADVNRGCVLGQAPIGRGTAPHLFVTSNGGASWVGDRTWSNQGAATTRFNGVSAIPTSGAFEFTLVGDGGTIWRGPTYQTAQPSVTTANLLAVDFADTDNGIAVGAGGTIVHTTNGGATWRKQFSGTNAALLGVAFVNDSTGWAVGEGGTILHTRASAQPAAPALAIYNDELQSPWINASWGSTVTFNSTEAANTGSRSIKVEAGAWGAVSLHHGNWGSEGIKDSGSYQSIDLAIYPGSPSTFQLSFANDQGEPFPSVTLSVGTGTWMPVSVPMNQVNPDHRTIHRLSLQKSTAGIFYVDDIRLVGAVQGAPAIAAGSGPSDVRDLPREFGLDQNYPNPFNPTTEIHYEIPGGVRSQETGVSRVSLTVYDMLGREVAVLTDEEKTPGFYSVSFDAGRLASGVYIYRIVATSGNGAPFVKAHRMLLLK